MSFHTTAFPVPNSQFGAIPGLYKSLRTSDSGVCSYFRVSDLVRELGLDTAMEFLSLSQDDLRYLCDADEHAMNFSLKDPTLVDFIRRSPNVHAKFYMVESCVYRPKVARFLLKLGYSSAILGTSGQYRKNSSVGFLNACWVHHADPAPETLTAPVFCYQHTCCGAPVYLDQKTAQLLFHVHRVCDQPRQFYRHPLGLGDQWLTDEELALNPIFYVRNPTEYCRETSCEQDVKVDDSLDGMEMKTIVV